MNAVQLRDGRSVKVRVAGERDAQALIDYCNAVGGESPYLGFRRVSSTTSC